MRKENGMWKKRNWAMALFLLLVGVTLAYPQKINVFNAMTIVELVKDRIVKIKTFTGSFTYLYNGKEYKGNIYYKGPDKFAMIYNNGQKMISDGKYLWLIFSGESVAVKEYLDKNNANPMIGWNIKRLLREYVPALPQSGGYKVARGNAFVYRLMFVPKSNTAGFRGMEMEVDPDGYIRKVKAINQLGKPLELSLTYANINSPVGESVFEFQPDEETQIYENILIPSGNEE